MVLPDLVLYLEQQGLGVRAVDIFYGVSNPEPDACIVLYEYDALPNEPELGGETVRLEFPLVQAMTRGVANEYDLPRLKLQQVVAAFTKIGDELINGTYYLAALAKGGPRHLKQDANFRHYFTCNFQITKDYSAT